MEQVLVSGSAGFIGGYVVEELLNRGYAVVGLDNFSKYGKVRKSYDDNPRYRRLDLKLAQNAAQSSRCHHAIGCASRAACRSARTPPYTSRVARASRSRRARAP